ncbi:MAG: cupin domain-containing protein [Bacteroidetes bacterium]|nr:cupin domain-containing protein [Bacteroidota bacterium]
MRRLTLIIIAICICFAVKAQYNKGIIIEPILKTDTTSIGQKLIYPNFQNSEVTISKITLQPGQSTGWHKHTFPVFAYVLKGNLTVELENHKTLQFSENSSFSEVIETFHNGINKGKEDVVLIAFFMGEKGKPLSVHQ